MAGASLGRAKACCANLGRRTAGRKCPEFDGSSCIGKSGWRCSQHTRSGGFACPAIQVSSGVATFCIGRYNSVLRSDMRFRLHWQVYMSQVETLPHHQPQPSAAIWTYGGNTVRQVRLVGPKPVVELARRGDQPLPRPRSHPLAATGPQSDCPACRSSPPSGSKCGPRNWCSTAASTRPIAG